MVRFEENFLEIALVTYNRPECIKKWINICFEQIKLRNIRFSIYDSSTNDKTKRIVEEENKVNGDYIKYIRIDSSVNIGYKAVIPMMSSQCKYVWICADRRYHDFIELDKYIFPKLLERKYAYIQLGLKWTNDPYEKEYTNKSEWFYDNFTGMSCYGLLIYRTDMFRKLEKDEKLFNYCEEHFKNENYGTAFLGYFLTAFAMEDYMAYIHCVEYYTISMQTSTTWHDRYYTCSVGDSVNLLNNIPDVYASKYMAVKHAHEIGECFSDTMLYMGRTKGDLCQVYEEYKEKGYWELFTADTDKVEFYAKAPLDVVKKYYFIDYIGAGLGTCTDDDLMIAINKVIDDLRTIYNKKVYIYGAGHGGKLAEITLKRNNIGINGYIDKNWEKIKRINNLDVTWLDSLNPQDSIVIVCLKRYYKEVEEDCNKYGFSGDNLIYLVKRMIG